LIVVPNGVEVTAAAPLTSLRRGLRLLYLGRLDPIKGLEVLLDACTELEGEPPFEWTLTIAGSGNPTYSASISDRIQRLGLGGRVTLAGEVVGSRKDDLLAFSHVVIVPSHSESFGMVVAEALAHGRPVIASRDTPWNELENRGCGLWVENTPRVLADAIRRISQMPIEEMGEKGRRWMRADFDWTKVADRMEGIYKALLENAA
jgi:glycosyltransferase involved in cell wall biosynthesis